MHRLQCAGLVVLVLVLSSALPARADVMIETAMKSGGIRGMGAFEGTTMSSLSGLRERSESTFKFTGTFLGALQRMAGGGPSVTITRVDKGVIWIINPEKKSYIEQPITARRPEPGTQQRQRPEQEKSDVVITKSEFKVERTGTKRTINGFPCEEYIETWLIETLNQKTQERGRSLMKSNLWTTSESADIARAREEQHAYHQAYLKKAGLEVSPEEARRLGINMFASFSGASEKEIERGLAKASAELKKIQGYPILTHVEWTLEGQEGKSSAASPPRPGESGGSGGLGGALGGLLGGLRGGSGQGQSSSSAASGEGGPLITITTEVKSIKIAPIPAAQFEVPGDFVKQ